MSTSPVPLSQINFLPLRVPGSPLALMVGGSVAGSLLSTMTGNPLATLVSEAIANLQSSIDTINRVVSQPPVLQSLTLNSADIGTLNVASLYGPGQLAVFQGPPSFPLIGWVGSEAAPYQSPTTTITSTTAGTVTTSVAHGLLVNQIVQMLGTTNAAQNGFFVVATVPTNTTFTVTGFSGSSTGGTVQRVLVGGWFKTLAVGGTSYLGAIANGLFADENGNLTVQAATVVGQLNAAQVNAQSLNISDILVSGLTLTNNSPGAGQVAWSACTVYYQHVAYSISSGNTSTTQPFITWTIGAGTFTASVSYTPGPTIFQIATNSGGTSDVSWNKVGAFGIQAAHMNDSTVNVVNLALTSNSPSAGNVAWSACTVNYQGVAYSITAADTGTSKDPFIYWTVGNTTFTHANTFTPSGTIFLIATNNGGTADVAWNKVANAHVQASHLFPVLTYDGPNGSLIISNVTFSDNTPIATSVQWSACQVTYQGVTYAVSSGNADSTHIFIIWRLSSPNQFQGIAGGFSLGVDDFIIGTNIPTGSPAAAGFFDRSHVYTDRTGAYTIVDETGIQGNNKNNKPTFACHRQAADAAVGAAGGIFVFDGTGSGSQQQAALKGNIANGGGAVGGMIYTRPCTFAQLPTSQVQGDHAYITDSNTAVFNAIAAGGGANVVPVTWNGANWVVG